MSEIRVNNIVAADGSSAPSFPAGFSLATGMGITNSPNLTGSAVTFSGLAQITNSTDSTSSTTGALVVTGGVGIAKDVYIGAGLSVAGTLTYEDVTNVDAVGLITARSGVNVSGGEFKVGTAVTISSTAGVSTFSGDTHFIGLGAKSIQWDTSAGQLDVLDNAKIKFGSGGDLAIFHDGSDNYISGDVDGMDLFIRSRKDVTISCGNNASGYHSVLYADNNGSTRLYHPDTDAIKLQTTNDGISITGMSTVTTGAHFQGMLREDCNIVANKLSAGTNIDLEDGMVHYYSTNETTTATPNIRWNSSYALNNKMSTGESVTVTIISKPNGAGYYTHLTVDGSAVTEYWNGGNTPSSANAGGFDVTTYQITKIGSGSFLVLANVQNYS